ATYKVKFITPETHKEEDMV
nr:ferredoxin b - Japanese radish (fragments) [Raphanus sativus var. niger]